MKTAERYLKNLDFFSVPFSPAINDNEEFYHKSIIGGLCSLVVICLSLTYGFYTFIQWQTLSLLPKVTQQYTIFEEYEKEMSYTISIKIESVGYTEDDSDTVNPFNPKAIIILPVISEAVDNYYSFINYQPYFNDDEFQLNLTIKNQSQPTVTFIKCNQEYLFEGQECANEETVNLFNKQIGNQLYLSVQFTIINPNTFTSNTIKRTYSIIIQENQCTTETLYLQMTKYDLDQGFIIGTNQYEYYFTDSTDQSQISSTEYCSRMWLPDTISVLWIVTQNQLRIESIVYPKVSEVLANIGSIASLLFMIKYILIQVNLFNMREKALNFLIEQYYPEIKKFTIIKTWYKKIKLIKFNDNEIDIKSFEEFRARIRSLIASKLNYINLVYELSRVQIILQSMQSRYYLRQSHFVGTKLRLKQCNFTDKYIIQDDTKFVQQTINCEEEFEFNPDEKQTDILQIGDAVLLGIQTKNSIKENCFIKNQNTTATSFYQINKVK